MELLHGVKNLLFDLGGVLMDLNRQRCVDAFVALGYRDADKMLGEYAQQGVFMALEEGKVSPEEFRTAIRHEIGKEVTDEAIDYALNQFLLGIPDAKLSLLRKLREHYRVMMLSNTNSIMFEQGIDRDFRIQGLTVNDYFDEKYLSYELGVAKPKPEIFEKVIALSGIKPEDTLFFDDSQANLDAAARFGFRTYLVAPFSDFSSLFNLE